MKTDIIILSRDFELLNKCLTSTFAYVDKKSVKDIYIGWNNPETLDVETYVPDNAYLIPKVIDVGEYNFAKNNNTIAKNYSTADCLLFLNDDVELVEDSVSRCLKWLQSPDVGTVGIKLLYPDKTIQHAGQFISVPAGCYKGCGHICWRQPDQKLPPLAVIGNTCAFCMLRRDDFLKVGGFDEQYKHCFEDVQLNLSIMKLGKHNICDNTTWAWHAESQTRKQNSCVDDFDRLKKFVESNLDILMTSKEEI